MLHCEITHVMLGKIFDVSETFRHIHFYFFIVCTVLIFMVYMFLNLEGDSNLLILIILDIILEFQETLKRFRFEDSTLQNNSKLDKHPSDNTEIHTPTAYFTHSNQFQNKSVGGSLIIHPPPFAAVYLKLRGCNSLAAIWNFSLALWGQVVAVVRLKTMKFRRYRKSMTMMMIGPPAAGGMRKINLERGNRGELDGVYVYIGMQHQHVRLMSIVRG